MKGVAVEFRPVNQQKGIMQTSVKTRVFCVALFSCAVAPVFSQVAPIGEREFAQRMGAFMQAMPKALPFQAVPGINWSDTCMGSRISGFGRFPLPLAIAETRIGGLPVPFDMGLKIGFMLNDIALFSREDYFIVDGELRPEGERIASAISFGVGFAHLRGRM